MFWFRVEVTQIDWIVTEGVGIHLLYFLFAVSALYLTMFPHIRNPRGLHNRYVSQSALDLQNLTSSCKERERFLHRLRCRRPEVVLKRQQYESMAVYMTAFTQWAHKLNYAIKTSMWKTISWWKVMIHTIWACFFWGEKKTRRFVMFHLLLNRIHLAIPSIDNCELLVAGPLLVWH